MAAILDPRTIRIAIMSETDRTGAASRRSGNATANKKMEVRRWLVNANSNS
jgi:hypothetical protein